MEIKPMTDKEVKLMGLLRAQGDTEIEALEALARYRSLKSDKSKQRFYENVFCNALQP